MFTEILKALTIDRIFQEIWCPHFQVQSFCLVTQIAFELAFKIVVIIVALRMR